MKARLRLIEVFRLGERVVAGQRHDRGHPRAGPQPDGQPLQRLGGRGLLLGQREERRTPRTGGPWRSPRRKVERGRPLGVDHLDRRLLAVGHALRLLRHRLDHARLATRYWPGLGSASSAERAVSHSSGSGWSGRRPASAPPPRSARPALGGEGRRGRNGVFDRAAGPGRAAGRGRERPGPRPGRPRRRADPGTTVRLWPPGIAPRGSDRSSLSSWISPPRRGGTARPPTAGHPGAIGAAAHAPRPPVGAVGPAERADQRHVLVAERPGLRRRRG